MKSKYVFTQQIKEMAKIFFSTLKIIVVKYGEIWFPWRNMVLCSTCDESLDKVVLSNFVCKGVAMLNLGLHAPAYWPLKAPHLTF